MGQIMQVGTFNLIVHRSSHAWDLAIQETLDLLNQVATSPFGVHGLSIVSDDCALVLDTLEA